MGSATNLMSAIHSNMVVKHDSRRKPFLSWGRAVNHREGDVVGRASRTHSLRNQGDLNRRQAAHGS